MVGEEEEEEGKEEEEIRGVGFIPNRTCFFFRFSFIDKRKQGSHDRDGAAPRLLLSLIARAGADPYLASKALSPGTLPLSNTNVLVSRLWLRRKMNSALRSKSCYDHR